jgi:DNA-binding response OmpR family regulator
MNQSAIRVLVVDDEAAIRRALRPPMLELGFQFSEASRGEEALQLLRSGTYDVVLLDINMPGIGGIETLRRIRAFAPRLPVLMVTVREGEEEKVEALELGADDYVTKPFSQRELMARIKAVLRRTEQKRASRREETVRAYRFSGWELTTGTRRLKSPDGRNVELTNSEYALLVAFLRAPQKILSRDQLLESSRLHDDIYDRSIDVQILRLRRKVEESPNQPKLIRTERGAGYYFNSTVETI